MALCSPMLPYITSYWNLLQVYFSVENLDFDFFYYTEKCAYFQREVFFWPTRKCMFICLSLIPYTKVVTYGQLGV